MNKIMASIGSFMVSLCAMAQTDTITGRVHQLEGVTVVESQRQHTLSSTAPLHLLDRRDMLTMGVADLADALHRLPGITLRDYGGAGGMKTVSVRGFGTKHTGVSYDGVLLSECQSGEIDLSRYSLDNIDHLSLVIGDNDDIFIPARQAASPAVLTIETLRMPTADVKPHLTTQLKVGLFGYVSPFVRYEQNINSELAISVVGDYTHADNDYPYTIKNVTETVSDHRTHSRMNTGHGELNWTWKSDGRRLLTGKVYYYDNDRQLPGVVHYYTNLSGETLRDRNAFAQVLYQTRLGEQVALRVHAKYNWAASIYRDKLYPGGVNDASYWQREAYASAALLYVPNLRWSFDYSADYAFNNLNGSSQRTVVGRPLRHSILQSATARYRHQRLTVLARLLASVFLNDARGSVSGRNMRRLSPSLSASYQPWADCRFFVRASYKNIFRAPTFNENYYYHYGSYDLMPESTHQWNVGMTWAGGDERTTQFQAMVDAYYNKVYDMIVAVPQNMFVWKCVNLGRVRVLGIDATLRASHTVGQGQQLSASANYSYQRVRNVTDTASDYYGLQTAYQPEHTFAASVSYEHPWLNGSVHVMGMSSRWANNEHYTGTRIDGFADCGVTLWRRFRLSGCHRLEARLDVRNIFNRQYEIVYHYPMPGRNYQVTINYKI